MTAIVLSFELSESWNRGSSGLDLRAADETTLRYRCFLGDVAFKVGDADFSARWGWVPVLDFAMSLRAIAASMVDAAKAEQTLEFTESDAEIGFEREGPIVKIEANYVPATAVVSYVDLSVAVEGFVARVVRELEQCFPPLAENAFVARLARDLAVSRSRLHEA